MVAMAVMIMLLLRPTIVLAASSASYPGPWPKVRPSSKSASNCPRPSSSANRSSRDFTSRTAIHRRANSDPVPWPNMQMAASPGPRRSDTIAVPRRSDHHYRHHYYLIIMITIIIIVITIVDIMPLSSSRCQKQGFAPPLRVYPPAPKLYTLHPKP